MELSIFSILKKVNSILRKNIIKRGFYPEGLSSGGVFVRRGFCLRGFYLWGFCPGPVYNQKIKVNDFLKATTMQKLKKAANDNSKFDFIEKYFNIRKLL